MKNRGNATGMGNGLSHEGLLSHVDATKLPPSSLRLQDGSGQRAVSFTALVGLSVPRGHSSKVAAGCETQHTQ